MGRGRPARQDSRQPGEVTAVALSPLKEVFLVAPGSPLGGEKCEIESTWGARGPVVSRTLACRNAQSVAILTAGWRIAAQIILLTIRLS